VGRLSNSRPLSHLLFLAGGRKRPSDYHQHRFQCIPDGYSLGDKSLERGDATARVHRGHAGQWRQDAVA
jgi:hypothetical protein